MSVPNSMLAEPPAEDLDSLDPVSLHSFEWRRRPGHHNRHTAIRSARPAKKAPARPVRSRFPIDGEADNLESRLARLEEIVHDCALMLRSSVVHRIEKLEDSLDSETARLEEKLHAEARRRCVLLTEVAQKVSAAIDRMRLEARSA